MVQWQAEVSAVVRHYHRTATIFYNAGHIGPQHRIMAEAFTHWELESLPSGGWGYLDFPSSPATRAPWAWTRSA